MVGTSLIAPEDIVQETMLRVLQSGKSPASIKDIRLYLIMEMRRQAIMTWRSNRTVPLPFDFLRNESVLSSDEGNVRQAEKREDEAVITRALASVPNLPLQQRHAFEQRVLQGRPVAAISQELGISPKRVSQLVTSAIKRLAVDLRGSTRTVAQLAEDVASSDNERISGQLLVAKLPGLVGPDGSALDPKSPQGKLLVARITRFSEDLLGELRRDPALLHGLRPRQFEELCAELLSRDGYEVELTAESRDGGIDIYAVRHDSLGAFLSLVQCKKYALSNRVGVSVVRELYGVVQAKRANAGVVATTSMFTKGAKEEQHELNFQIKLRDYSDIQEWLKLR